MIVDLPGTTTSAISKALVSIRDEGGAVALGRVLTLVIVGADGSEEVIEAANDASREHPMRVIVLRSAPGDESRLDAEIRVGGDAGASEVIVLHAHGEVCSDEEGLVTGLLLPDAPVVVWWPLAAPDSPSEHPLGRIAQRRITDAAGETDPVQALIGRGDHYAPGDTDFAWTRLTLWRAQLAAVLDQPPYEPITGGVVTGAADSPSTELLAAWLQHQLGAPIEVANVPRESGHGGIHGVRLHRASGSIELSRDESDIATLSQPGQPDHDLALPRRSLRDCLAEELRRLDPDELYGEVVRDGLHELLGTDR